MDAAKRSARKDKVLYADLLQPGDIILSSSYHPKDRIVVSATRKGNEHRRYSHAAWVVSPSLWFESTHEGTGFTSLRTGHVRWQAGERIRDVIDVSDHREMDVFRLPNIDPSRFEFNNPEFSAILDAVIGFEYPELAALAGTTEWLKRVPQLKRKLLNSVSPAAVNPGAFCSQLIVQIFDAAHEKGLVTEKVLKADLPSGNVSPNDLADLDISRLVRMQGFVEKRPIVVGTEGSNRLGVITYPFGEEMDLTVNKMKGYMVRIKRDGKASSDFTATMDQKTREMWAFLAANLRDGNLRLAFTNDAPFIEDHPTNPRLRKTQEDALEAGLNPGWLRLEGLASLFQFNQQQCKENIRKFAEAFTANLKLWNATPPPKLAAAIRKTNQWVAQSRNVFEIIKKSIEEMHEEGSKYYTGFPSDVVMIRWMKDLSGTLETVLVGFIEYLKSVTEVCMGVPEKVQRSGVEKATKGLVADLHGISATAREIIGSAQRLVASVSVDLDAVAEVKT